MTATRRSRPAPLALLAALVIAAFAVFGAAAPASAHDELVSSDPSADAALDALPEQLTLTFSAELLAGGGNEIQVTDAEGTALGGTPVVDGTLLTVPLEESATGPITVLWRAVSSDGHPISGEFGFTVTSAPSPTATAGTPSESPAASPSAPTADESASPSATPDPAPASDGASVLPWVILAIVVVVAGGAIAYLLVSRARRNGASGPGSTPGSDR